VGSGVAVTTEEEVVVPVGVGRHEQADETREMMFSPQALEA